MKAKWIEIILNIIFWITSSALIIGSFSIQSQEIELVNDIERVRTVRSETLMIKLLICIIFSAIVFYFNLVIILKLRQNWQHNKLIIISVFLPIIGYLAFSLINNLNLGIGKLPLPNAVVLGIMLFFYTVSIGYGIAKNWIYSEQTRQQLILEKNIAQLSLLRNQLQPHFLFNALNNLLSMVDQKNSPRLTQSFNRLSDLLRYVVEESNSEQVSIKDEKKFIEDYIALQLLRFEDEEVSIEMITNGEYYNQQIEPGLFIPFVENAFKFGTEPEKIAKIFIEFNLEKKDAVSFVIENEKLQGSTSHLRTGTGIKSVINRLNLVYPGKHTLNIIDDRNFKVELFLKTV